MKISITVCDVCQDPSRPVRNYRVLSEGRSAEADLCQEHGTVLEAIFGSDEQPARPVGRRRYQGLGVDEIEARRSRRAAGD